MPLDLQALDQLVAGQQEQLRAVNEQNKHLLRQHSALWEFHVSLLKQHRALCRCLTRTGHLSRMELLMEMQAHPTSERLCDTLEHLPACSGQPKGTSSCCSELVTEAPSEDAATGSTEDRDAGDGSPLAGLLPGFRPFRSELDEGGMAPPNDAEQSCLALLREVWQYSALADALGSALGVAGVLRFRAASRAGRECLRTVHARILLWEPSLAGPMGLNMGLDSPRPTAMTHGRKVFEEPRRERDGCGLLDVLRDAWQYSPLAEDLARAMDNVTFRQFEAASHATCECLRLASAARLLRRKSREETRRRQSAVRDLQAQRAQRRISGVTARQRAAEEASTNRVRAGASRLFSASPRRSTDLEVQVSSSRPSLSAAALRASTPITPRLGVAATREGAPGPHRSPPGVGSRPSTPMSNSRRASAPTAPGVAPAAKLTGATPRSAASGRSSVTATQRRRELAPLAAAPAGEGKRGRMVRLRGMRLRPEVNGEVGRLMRCAEWSENWLVVLRDGRSVLVRPCNVDFLAPKADGERRASQQLVAVPTPGELLGELPQHARPESPPVQPGQAAAFATSPRWRAS